MQIAPEANEFFLGIRPTSHKSVMNRQTDI